jgi:aquaporin Z
MRAVDIRIKQASGGFVGMRTSFRKNRKFYLQEALGLAIFMVSACFFSGIFFGQDGYFVSSFPAQVRQSLLALMMGATALFIFYAPFTSPSGSHINPAVTLTFLRLDKICRWDALFYILFQFLGGTLAVYLMAVFMGKNLTAAPLYHVITIPGEAGQTLAAITECFIAFIMMNMVLFTSDHPVLKKYTRILAAVLVFIYVKYAGPVSGFGMNPARSFASALLANNWTSFWIYLFMPLAGMLGAAELYLIVRTKKGPTVGR